MNASSDAAEQVVRLTLEGTEFAVKIHQGAQFHFWHQVHHRHYQCKAQHKG